MPGPHLAPNSYKYQNHIALEDVAEIYAGQRGRGRERMRGEGWERKGGSKKQAGAMAREPE